MKKTLALTFAAFLVFSMVLTSVSAQGENSGIPMVKYEGPWYMSHIISSLTS